MQTIASLAKRLDMSAEQAVEILTKLHIQVEGIDSEISDEHFDLLLDVDEDASTLDKKLQEIEKKEEQERKKAERERKAIEKQEAAAKRKEAAAKKKAAAAKKKAAAAKTPETDEEPESTETVATPVELEVLSEDAPAPAEETAPDVPPAKPKARVVAEILPDVEEEKVVVPADVQAPIVIGAGATQDELPIEIVRADGTHAGVSEIDLDTSSAEDTDSDAEGDLNPEVGLLALAERKRSEELRKRDKPKASRPLPTPDPEVVAEVIRKAHERSRKKIVKERVTPTAPVLAAAVVGEARQRPAATGKTAKKKQKRAEKLRVIEDSLRREAAATVRDFEAGVLSGPFRKKRKKRERDDVDLQEPQKGGVIEVGEAITVEQLADLMDLPVNDLILALMDEDVLATKNQVLELDLVRRIAANYNFEVHAVIPEEETILAEEPDDPADLVLRAPVVTVMGHVDHGKTSLLDVVREANVVSGEAGGITQHIAAYDVELPSGRIVFLDTPGHEAFTQMRSRGAKITDVVVLVVAADDGVKPQTIEAIDHARAAEVPIVVAVNKCDKPDAQPERVRQELTKYELLDEAWGGKTIIKNISCQTREGITELMEMLALEAEMLELRANPNKRARGTVVESEMLRGQGPVAWVLVQTGTLKLGDYFLCGTTFGRVRTMMSSRGTQVAKTGPSTPVLVTGFSETPDAGDTFVAVPDERSARSVAEKRLSLKKLKAAAPARHMTLEDFHARMEGVEQKALNLIIKADTQGSVDVLQSSLARIGNTEVAVSVVHSGVGSINSSDVMLASASDAVILGFHVTANPKIKRLAEEEGVDIRLYLVIYEAIEQVRSALEGLLTPDSKEVVTGHAEIRQVFRSSAIGAIAGCYQLDGTTERGGKARLIRDGVVVFEGTISTLRRNKDDVKSVATGFECGIKLERFNDIQENDVIESFRIDSVAKTLN